MLAAQQLAQNRLVMLGRGVERHDRQRQHLLGYCNPPFGGQHRIGQDRGRGGGSVDQRPALSGLQLEPLRQPGEERVEDQDFARPALALSRHAGNRARFNIPTKSLDQPRRRHPVTAEQIGEPRKDHGARDAKRVGLAERHGSGQGFQAGEAPPILLVECPPRPSRHAPCSRHRPTHSGLRRGSA